MHKALLDFDYISGDPFVEAGRRIIIERTGKKQISIDELNKLVDWALQYYVDQWNGKLNAVSLNGTITQPAFKGNRKKEETFHYFERIFDHLECSRGDCQVCGRNASLFPADRSNMPLTGSSTNPNFHSYFSKGIMLCPECLSGLFFMPFAVINAGKCLLLINTLSEEIFKCWLNETLHLTVTALKSEGITASKRKILSNQLYYFANRLSVLDENVLRMESVNFYYFTNFGASPECTFIHLSNGILLFLKGIRDEKQNIHSDFSGTFFSFMMKKDYMMSDEWNNFIWRHYRKADAVFDKERNEYLIKEKKSLNSVSEEEVCQWYNPVIDKLMNNTNILVYLRKSGVSSRLAGYYCMEVLKMDKERIKVLIGLADKIADLIEKQEKTDILVALQKGGTLSEFRFALLKAMRHYARSGNEEPLFTTDEYLYKIFPDGEYWHDARDLMLVRLYEKLHKMLSGKSIDTDIEMEAVQTNKEEDI